MVVCLDWDDTLLPSSYLSNFDISIIFIHQRDFRHLELLICSILKKFLEKNDVYIITAAEAKWISISAQIYIPGAIPYLSRCKIISARDRYQKQFPNDATKWKYLVFSELIKEDTSELISIGDSLAERKAAQNLVDKKDNIVIKTIKMVNKPHINALTKQLSHLLKNCSYILDYPNNLDLMLTLTY